MTPKRERRTGGDIYEVIIKKGRLGWKPAELLRHLNSIDEFKGRVPHKRTIKRILDEDLPKRVDPWRFAETNVDIYHPAHARHALDVLAYVVEHSNHRINNLTVEEAEWSIRIRLAYPDMPAQLVWETIGAMFRESIDWFEEPFTEIDVVLALQGWREENRERASDIQLTRFVDAWQDLETTVDKLVERHPQWAEAFGRAPRVEEGSDDE